MFDTSVAYSNLLFAIDQMQSEILWLKMYLRVCNKAIDPILNYGEKAIKSLAISGSSCFVVQEKMLASRLAIAS